MDYIRIFQVFGAHSVIIFVCLLLSYFLLRPPRSNKKTIFACFYIFLSLGLILNWIYYFIFIEEIVLIIYYIAIISSYGSGNFVVIFALMYWKGEEIITPLRQIIIALISYAFFSFSIFIPNGVVINASTNWKPVWSAPLTLYFFIVIIIFQVIPIFYLMIKRIADIDPIEKNVKIGWRVFLIGSTLYIFGGLQIILVRVYFSGWVLLISGITNIILMIIGPTLMYYGLNHEFKV